MVRYVHYELMCSFVAVCAAAVSSAVAFSVRGAPEFEAGLGKTLASFAFLGAFGAAWGLLTCSRLKWVGEGHEFDTAVPLENPDAVLPTPGSELRGSVNGILFAFMVVSALLGAFLWDRMLALCPLMFAPPWLTRAAYAARWERRHGLLLWQGEVDDQPLGEDQFLYSSVRQATR
ncbi:hypothetical protein [Streptomyces sporangiiformans]|uniref:Uncharacterized protein n=1 Tax=Streptomyces sporangiiformans TaxID=2315329 RepID=A0A505D0B2_9ACTN|nr:hypothetical protein [Streptomyces sporangiiformans]TPQ17793.1 hypothetical protein FGD71_034595 [Streptomyces sporangiiformans]